MHATMLEYIRLLESQGRTRSAATYAFGLRFFWSYLQPRGLDPLTLTLADLQGFQRYMAHEYKKADGKPLGRDTQVARFTPIRAYYRHLFRRGLILSNPAKGLRLPSQRRRVTLKNYLELQEATALVQTQAGNVAKAKKATRRWATEFRNLAVLCLGLSTGKRRESLMALRLSDLDVERRELRIDREKGVPGRVVPVIGWAVEVCEGYRRDARPVLMKGKPEDHGWLFPGTIEEKMSGDAFANLLERLQTQAADENPDLEGLRKKHLTPHSLRVSFATLLFSGGCNIRSINELMLHSTLSQTAKYTPIPLEDLRRTCRLTHPRA